MRRVVTSYYGNVNVDLLDRLPLDAGQVVEIGCGEGALGRAFKRRNPGVRYIGVELFEEAASTARQRLDEVIVGSIETPEVRRELEARLAGRSIDALIFGDVLEHLRDPWEVLSFLRTHMAPHGVCVSCIPNVAHWSIIVGLLGGKWDYADSGLLDRTHLRFFTRKTAVDMFSAAGWKVHDVTSRIFAKEKVDHALELLTPAIRALGIDMGQASANIAAFQWVVRARPADGEPDLRIAALALKKVAAVNEARIDNPLRAMKSRPGVQAIWGERSLSLPPGKPGVLILHRQFLNSQAQQDMVERMAAAGWVIVSEMDDDPDRWPEYGSVDYRAFRGVHAVTVSTGPLADLIRTWAPEVKVFPNAIYELPPRGVPARQDRVRVFFGALNREDDWRPVMPAIADVARRLSDRVEFVVVHDQAFYDALPSTCSKMIFPTLNHQDYMKQLASCQVSLLPLAPTRFNRMKSDLKLIESLACGAVPVCSPTVYADHGEHQNLAVFADSPAEWGEALERLVMDADAREALAARGMLYVREQRMHAQQVAEREQYYRGLIARLPELEAARRARLGI
jgi:2-polyprenyl-3-methyl-5-hydroxy-6-metoxy-1,4-benzoquinol methylase